MNYNRSHQIPSIVNRVYSVWYRHFRVYISNFYSNAFPPFLEPLIYLFGLGIAVGGFIQTIGGFDYLLFLASGLIITSAMFAAAYECTYGTFVRLEFDGVYDGMLGAPVSTEDLVMGELLFVGTKGFFFSFAVLLVVWLLGIITYPLSIFTPLVGFLAGIMFGTLSLLVTSLLKNINHFNFYFTGLITPMFFFSGVLSPIDTLPRPLMYLAEIIPLTHVVRLARAFAIPDQLGTYLFYDLAYCVIFIAITGWLAIRGLKKRLIT